MQHIGIVGAGIAGLACAEELARQGCAVQLFDKGRAPGGRMSSRRMETSAGEVLFDHGAQYFTARDEAFQLEVARWSSEGIIAAWPAAGSGAYVGVPGMDAPVRFLAARQSVRWTTAVRQIVKHGTQWRLLLDAGEAVDVDVALVAIPAEQAADLLDTVAPPFAARARATTSDPCWTLMLAFHDAVAVHQDCWRSEAIVGWAARNSSKPGREGPESWVIQAGPSWSRQHLEAAPDEVSRMLRAEFATMIAAPLAPIVGEACHRWRFARSGGEGSKALFDSAARIGVCGDWLVGPRVEAAWLSGRALADRVNSV